MRQDAANNRDAIVAATRQLLVSEGPGVSMRTIAKTASVGVATATRHFPERIDLLEAVSAQAVGNIADAIEEHLGGFVTDPRTAWRTTVHAIGELQLAALAQAIFAETMQDPEVMQHRQDIVEKRTAELRTHYDRLLRRAKEANLCPTDLDPLEFHLSLGVVTRPLPAGAPKIVGATQLARNLVDVMLDGLEARVK